VLTVATVNVNGVRAAERRGMPAWLQQRNPDVLCLQEVRGTDDHLSAAVGPGWHAVHQAGAAAGHAGVAVLTRVAPQAVRAGLGDGEFADGGRWVEADLQLDGGSPTRGSRSGGSPVGGAVLTVVSAYVHTGEAGTERQQLKYRFLAEATKRLAELRSAGHEVLLTGDLNIAHREADLKNWKGNRGKAGFLPDERAWFDDLLEGGFVDVLRVHAGDVDGPYSWWSWRGQAFDNDSGWRIDYQLATTGLAATAVDAVVDRAPSYAERWSDHAPVVARYATRAHDRQRVTTST
jgi:exodeoxyribonuclease-3